MQKRELFDVSPQVPNNFYARGAHGMATSYDRAAVAGSDVSRLRVSDVGPHGAWVKHLPSEHFPPADDMSRQAEGVFVLCGCAYLSASFWPETIAAAHRALDTHGVGSYDSAPLSGETAHHEALKNELLKLYYPDGGGAAFLTVSASMSNITTIPMLVGKDDLIFIDSEGHMTLSEGSALSQAKVERFPHNDLDELERRLIKARADDPHGTRRVLVITDGIFSMSGHVCDLPAMVALRDQYGFLLLVDEAHALGALGPRGRGTADHWGMDASCIDIVTGTLAKAIGAQGGYMVCSAALARQASLEYATNRVFSSGVPASIAAAATEVLRQINAAPKAQNTFSEMYRRQRRNASILREYLRRLPAIGIGSNPDEAPGTVQRLMLGDEEVLFEVQARLYRRRVYVMGLVYPVVPRGKEQIRVTVMPSIDEDDMHACGRAIVEVCSAVMAECASR